jgi:hypothetical protein
VPASSVAIVKDLESAIAQSDPDNKYYATKVAGPARSSEGTMLYYIIEMYNAQCSG